MKKLKMIEQPAVKGLGKQFGLLKGIKKVDNKSNLKENSTCNGSESGAVCKNSEKEMILQDLLSDKAFTVLEESKTDLHIKTPNELIEMADADFALPKLVELSDKLPHAQSLCIHEMIARAYKHILQAVIASVNVVEDFARSIATCLNFLLGTSTVEEDSKLKQKWIETFIFKRFGWRWNEECC
ncbi:hypothetical protein ZOSMA_300G00030 [Zostera marina]|uniref:CLU central domain-containing protein n=1 Tax=Zostera marina TaxID=29655 RepID=A0A0K9PA84_ZOSMR|nr:hypothetical protein ZOSMA_300G00030 [Zostera marina]